MSQLPDMEATLDELRGLVLVAEMPDGTRAHLMQGLHHIQAHLRIQKPKRWLVRLIEGILGKYK